MCNQCENTGLVLNPDVFGIPLINCSFCSKSNKTRLITKDEEVELEKAIETMKNMMTFEQFLNYGNPCTQVNLVSSCSCLFCKAYGRK